MTTFRFALTEVADADGTQLPEDSPTSIIATPGSISSVEWTPGAQNILQFTFNIEFTAAPPASPRPDGKYYCLIEEILTDEHEGWEAEVTRYIMQITVTDGQLKIDRTLTAIDGVDWGATYTSLVFRNALGDVTPDSPKMPEVGGIGTVIMYIAGAVIMTAAFVAAVVISNKNKRKKKRRKKGSTASGVSSGTEGRYDKRE
jgi:hypothetical protein